MARAHHRRRLLPVLAAAAAALALAGCGGSSAEELLGGDAARERGAEEDAREDSGDSGDSEDGGDAEEPGDTAGTEDKDAQDTGPEPDPDSTELPGTLPDEYDFTPNPDRIPTNAEEARALTTGAQLDPEEWWQGLAPHDPYEIPGTWTVLGEDCVWSRGPLPEHVLDSFTRRYHLPAADEAGEVLATLTVSVHRSEEDAEREIEDTVAESYRCPEQDLGGGQQLTGLISQELPEEDVLNADATLFEMGQWSPPGVAESHDYYWVKSRIGPVTAAISIKSSEGHETQELLQMSGEGMARVLYAIELELT